MDVHVPQWGGSVKLRRIPANEQKTLYHKSFKQGQFDYEEYMLRMFISGVIEPKFTLGDIFALQTKSAEAINLVVNKIEAMCYQEDKAVSPRWQ